MQLEEPKSADTEAEPGLQIVHEDGMIRHYYTNKLVQTSSKDNTEIKGEGEIAFHMGTGPKLSNAEVQKVCTPSDPVILF